MHTRMCAHTQTHTHEAQSTALSRQKISDHSNNAFVIYPSSFIALMSIKQAHDSFRITSLSLHLSLLMPAFKLGTCRLLLIIISTLTTASKVSVNTWTLFWQTLHRQRKEGTDPNTKSFQLKWMAGAKANRETEDLSKALQSTSENRPWTSLMFPWTFNR